MFKNRKLEVRFVRNGQADAVSDGAKTTKEEYVLFTRELIREVVKGVVLTAGAVAVMSLAVNATLITVDNITTKK